MDVTGWRILQPGCGWLPRASIGLGIAATVVMNVAAGSRGGDGGALVGTLTPVGFVVSLETLIFLVRKLARLPWGWAWFLGSGLPLAGLAAITGVISYLHALTVAQWTANPAEAGLPLTEHLLPLVADLMIATGSVALVALAVAAKDPAVKPLAAESPAVLGRGAGMVASDGRLSPREAPAPGQPAVPAARKRAPAGARAMQPAAQPKPGDPPASVIRDALAAGVTDRALAAAHGISRDRAIKLMKPGSYALAASVNGHEFREG